MIQCILYTKRSQYSHVIQVYVYVEIKIIFRATGFFTELTYLSISVFIGTFQIFVSQAC